MLANFFPGPREPISLRCPSTRASFSFFLMFASFSLSIILFLRKKILQICFSFYFSVFIFLLLLLLCKKHFPSQNIFPLFLLRSTSLQKHIFSFSKDFHPFPFHIDRWDNILSYSLQLPNTSELEII